MDGVEDFMIDVIDIESENNDNGANKGLSVVRVNDTNMSVNC
jgi:hypothetical protein